jgi:two-component system LytT family response regulator
VTGSARSGDLTVLIADDEALARRRVAELLRDRKGVRVVGQTGTGPATLDAIRRLEPDLVFLDVQMPGLTGFEVLAELANEERPAIVFSTAYDEYALAAFDVHAVDYLLKPYDDARFDEALQRAAGTLRSERLGDFHERVRALLGQVAREPEADVGAPIASSSARYRERFAVPTGARVTVVAAVTVDWIEASGDYVNLHAGENTHLLRATMTALEACLDPGRFARIHRSIIVQLDRVRYLKTGPHGEHLAVLERGEALRVGPTYRSALLERLGMRW